MREIIVTYNAEHLGIPAGGLERVIDVFEHDPKPDTALYVANTRYGVELGAVIAMYTTEDPEGLVRALKESYGAAISTIEESERMEAYPTDAKRTEATNDSKDTSKQEN